MTTRPTSKMAALAELHATDEYRHALEIKHAEYLRERRARNPHLALLHDTLAAGGTIADYATRRDMILPAEQVTR